MVRLLRLLREIETSDHFTFVGADRTRHTSVGSRDQGEGLPGIASQSWRSSVLVEDRAARAERHVTRADLRVAEVGLREPEAQVAQAQARIEAGRAALRVTMVETAERQEQLNRSKTLAEKPPFQWKNVSINATPFRL